MNRLSRRARAGENPPATDPATATPRAPAGSFAGRVARRPAARSPGTRG